ncbi:MAG: hypothetical protein J6V90_12875 [Treponema sp.]|nr:hypothetical protein [Treponema sp.]
MSDSQIILSALQLCLGGLCAFAAILLCAKKRSAGVICLLAFVLTSYARTVYQLLCDLGIVTDLKVALFGVPLLTLAFESVPPIFLLLALIIMIAKKK